MERAKRLCAGFLALSLLLLFGGVSSCAARTGPVRESAAPGPSPSSVLSTEVQQVAADIPPMGTATPTGQPQAPAPPAPRPGAPATKPPSSAPSVPAAAPTPAAAAAPVPVQAPPPPAQPAKPKEPPKGTGVVFNFDNADLYEVIRVMAEIMKINYLIDPRVKGVVNIHTAGQIATEDIFPIFQSILQLNGATAVKKENLYEIVPFGEAKKLYTQPSAVQEPGKPPGDEKYVIQIFRLNYIPVAEVSKMIKPFVSDGADIVEHPPSNILILCDLASNVRKIVDIVTIFDIDVFTDLRVRIYPVFNADVADVAKEMEKVFASFEVSLKSGRGVGITFTPIVRINSLLAVSSIPNIFDKVEAWLRQLDQAPGEGTKLSVFVYYVQNMKAKDLADVLKQVFVPSKEKRVERPATTPAAPTTPGPRGVRPTPGQPQPPVTGPEEAGLPEGEIGVVVDETNNALVIRAFHRDYRYILETIKKLDIYPKQVLIEVFLAAVTLDDQNKFGLEWGRYITSNKPNAQQFTISSVPPDEPFKQALRAFGFQYSIVALGEKVAAALEAAAAEGRLNVVSSPHVLASNNKEAKIQIGKSQPILTNTYTTTGTATTGVVEGTIEYKDIGIILTVTPRISDAGLISLELSIEQSDVSYTTLGNLPSVPVFDKKTAKTVLSVSEGQTIVIGGLMEDSKQRGTAGVPILSKIPIFGALFGTQQYVNRKIEYMLVMTPHIITDHIRSKSVTDEFIGKLKELRKDFEERTGMPSPKVR